MGKTIDEHIEQLKQIPMRDELSVEYLTCIYETIDAAIDIMQKYQKIQEIVRWNDAPSPYYKPDGQLFREIIEVLDDGNDD